MDNAFHGSAHTAVQVGHVHGHVHVHNTAPGADVPRQLPAPRLLVDRHESTAWLERSWSLRQGPLWAAVEGPSGVGKTALVTSWEVARRDRWPDGALYTDLYRTGVEATLARWLHALDRPAPEGAEQVRAAWRSATATRSLLVLVDNAHTIPDQVHHLLPAGSDCAGLTAGHHHMADLVAPGARLLRLGPLPDAATAELITTLTARSPGGPHACVTVPNGKHAAAPRPSWRAWPQGGVHGFRRHSPGPPVWATHSSNERSNTGWTNQPIPAHGSRTRPTRAPTAPPASTPTTKPFTSRDQHPSQRQRGSSGMWSSAQGTAHPISSGPRIVSAACRKSTGMR